MAKKKSNKSTRKGARKSVLLSGGNPQIAKADGDTPVQAYIAAMPGWKTDVGRQLDVLIEDSVPHVRKAVRWNSPFYGIEDQGWFLSYHCFTKYVKVTFLNGSSLRPMPPVESKQPEVRYFHIYENDELDADSSVAGSLKQQNCPATNSFKKRGTYEYCVVGFSRPSGTSYRDGGGVEVIQLRRTNHAVSQGNPPKHLARDGSL